MTIDDDRLKTQRGRILYMLKEADNEGCTNFELAKVSLRYGAHLGVLYTKGYKIRKMRLDSGVFRYFLLSVPGDIKQFSNAQEEIFNEIAIGYDGLISTEELANLLESKHFHIIRKPGWYEQQFLN